MSEISIDLSNHEFEDGTKIFFDEEISLKNKNFIFAKNGSGKSTLSEIINRQKLENFDIRIFDGFDNLLGENENLDAFALAVDAGKNEKKIESINVELKQMKSEIQKIQEKVRKPEEDSQAEENLYTEFQNLEENYTKEEKKINNFFTKSAQKIVESNPKIVENSRSYRAPNFRDEISKALQLSEKEIENFEQTLKIEKRQAYKIFYQNPDCASFLKAVNEILQSKVEEVQVIERISNQTKRNFAQKGFEIYKGTQDEICAFCGNQIENHTLEELKQYFDADKVKLLKDRILKLKEDISEEIKKLSEISFDKTSFYPSFAEKAAKMAENFQLAKNKQLNEFWNVLLNALDQKDVFEKSDEQVIQVPISFYFDGYNRLVDENIQFTENFEMEQMSARKKLRYHKIRLLCNEEDYDKKINNLKQLETEKNKREQEISILNKKINELEEKALELELEIEGLKPKAEKKAIENINNKLSFYVSWELDFYENEMSGYYHIVQNKKHRSVNQLSTGEKNIIAFLYFIERIEELKQNENGKKPKIIIFDDPMNSNDDTMQYLIISELQKLYQAKGEHKNKFNVSKDYIVILTHNVHFYLNVQPHGAFEDSKGRTKYDKCGFFRLQNGNFLPIKSEKQDFKTHYDAIWLELQSLVDADLRNSMLNSMRRIIETYIEFNSLNQDNFYKNNEQYLKLFNVNSHSAIENTSSEAFTETAEELKCLFKKIFVENDAKRHFEAHWKEVGNEKS